MFGRHFSRRRPPWDAEAEGPDFGDEEGWERGRIHHHHRRWHGPWPGRHFERWFPPPFAGPGAAFWFSPRGRDRFGPPFGHRGPFGPGGPFGDDPFDEDGGGRRRQRRGDIKYALLELLAEQPRHGYELIKELEQRYAGFYRPSPGSVYPTLQLLEDEGHLTSELVDGKRIYTITESGRQLLTEHQQRRADEGDAGWRHGFRRGHVGPELDDLRRSSMALAASVMQVGIHGTPDQARAAVALLDGVRREIYAILAQDQAADAPEGE